MRYDLLDGLRGIAALMVVWFHMATALDVDETVANGILAVDFFFVLSGFVIAHAYDDRLRQGLTFFRFFTSRLGRLYPVYLASLGIAIVDVLLGQLIGSPEYSNYQIAITTATNLLFVPTPPGAAIEPYAFPLNLPAWSLLCELVANMAFAALFTKLRGVALCLLIGSGFLAVVRLSHLHPDVNGGVTWATLPLGFARVTFSFFAGVAIYRVRQAIPRPRPMLAAACTIGLVLTLTLDVNPRLIYDWFAIGLLLPLLVYAAARVEAPKPLASLAKSAGVASYPLYAIHMPLLALTIRFTDRLFGLGWGEWTAPMSIAFCVAVSCAAYALGRVDEAFRRRLMPRPIVSTSQAQTEPVPRSS